MADPVQLHHPRTLAGTLPADGADPTDIQPSDFGAAHVLGGATADRKAALSKSSETAKSIWDWLRYADVYTPDLTNATGGGLVEGDVVALSATPGQVALDDTLASQNHFVVCAEASLANSSAGRFRALGIIPVVKNKGAVTAGQYVKKSATTKAVETTAIAASATRQPPDGSLGLALSTQAGDGTISVLWFARPIPYLPPLATAGYLKATGSAYAVQAAPIPIADISTGTPTGAKFLRDDGVLAEPPSGGGSNVLDRVTSNVTVANTTTETTVYSKQIDANTLGTSKRLRLVVHCIWGGNGVVIGGSFAKTIQFKLKYGATTVITSTVAAVEDAGNTVQLGQAPSVLEFLLSADGATNAQLGTALIRGTSLAGTTGVPYESIAGNNVHEGTGAEDSTQNLNLVVTAKWNNANPALSFTLKHAVLELL